MRPGMWLLCLSLSVASQGCQSPARGKEPTSSAPGHAPGAGSGVSSSSVENRGADDDAGARNDEALHRLIAPGLMQFTRTTAVIHAAEHIRLNCVVPGLMHTPLIDGLAARYAGGDTQGFIDHRNGQVPMRQMGTGWDTAHAALFLAADESRYVTGTCIVVDGGLVAATR